MFDKFLFDTIYHTTYFCAAFFAFLMALRYDFRGSSIVQAKIGRFFTFFFSAVLFLAVGLRDFSVGTDTINYYLAWNLFDGFTFDSDFLFYMLMLLVKSLGIDYQGFLLFISFLFFFYIYRILNETTKINGVNLFFAFFIFFSLFFFRSMSINVLRQGLSLLLLTYAYVKFVNGKRGLSLVYAFLSVSMHLTSIIPILLFVLTYLMRNVSYYKFYVLYGASIVLSYLNFGIKNIAPFLVDLLGDERRANYLDDDEADVYVIEFKMQFVLFNTLFLLIFSYIKRFGIKGYDLLFKYFILASCVFYFAFQLAYSDRWGLFSWVILPLLLQPLLLKEYKNRIPLVLTIFSLILIYIFFNVLYK